jgi:transcriptional regulator with XRE-family HTH domain
MRRALHSRSPPARLLTPAVPFCHLTFSVVRGPIPRYERTKVPLGTLGAAFRQRRWSRGLEQLQAASEIGVSAATYCAWETNRREPALRHLPTAIRFLGFDWRQPPTSIGAQIHQARTAAGLSIRELAVRLRADPTTVRGWEAGLHAPSRRSVVIINEWLADVSTSDRKTT